MLQSTHGIGFAVGRNQTARFVKGRALEVSHLDVSFDEVHVYDGIGERTGVTVDRKDVRGCPSVCRSVTELAAKTRRLGDGYYYVASTAWPADTPKVNLISPWVSLG